MMNIVIEILHLSKLTCRSPTVDGLIWISNNRDIPLLSERLHKIILRCICVLNNMSHQLLPSFVRSHDGVPEIRPLERVSPKRRRVSPVGGA